MKTIRFRCPACNQKFEAPPEAAGQPVKCPSCDIGFVPPERRQWPWTKTWRTWLGPVASLVIGGGTCVFCLAILPATYHEHHEWPAAAALAGCVFFFAGAADLFWSCIRAERRARVLFFLGLIIMLGAFLFAQSIPGILVGGFVTLVGFGGIAIQQLAPKK
jgi:hypothetical protein